MMKRAILTDSAANISKEFLDQNDELFVVPLTIVVNGVAYLDGVEISAEEVYRDLDQKEVLTSLPSGKAVQQVLDEMEQAGFDEIIYIGISSGLSGSVPFIKSLLEESVFVYNIMDTRTLAGQEGFLVEHALQMLKEEYPTEEILKELIDIRDNGSRAFYTINTLKYLQRGGRIGKVAAMVAKSFRIKPVITVNHDGVYEVKSNYLGLKRAIQGMNEWVMKEFQEPIDLKIHFGLDREAANRLKEALSKVQNIRSIVIEQLTPVLGVHTGPDLIALIACKVSKPRAHPYF